jgi:radical SAM superfamily enzyme YgiQ (UPF0313 family)
MKIRLIMPRAKRLSRNGSRFRTPPFGLTMVAALTPRDCTVTIEDENVEEISFQDDVDLVGISSFTSNVDRAYEIADAYRGRGVPVVMGGFHVTAMPHEALRHADAVVVGEAETVWSKVIDDRRNGRLAGLYKATAFHDMVGLPHPRLDLLRRPRKYTVLQMVQMTRGCPYSCEFCSTSTFWGHRYRSRPVDEVVEEIRRLDRTKPVFFVDDDIAGLPDRARELFARLIPLRIRWASQAGLRIARDDALLDLAQESGCGLLFLGFETLERQNLAQARKNQNNPAAYEQIVRKLHDRGIVVVAALVTGLDGDTREVFAGLDEFLRESKVDCPQVNILYPYPGTRIRERLLKEGRLTSDDWTNYVLAGVNYLPKRMTQQELHDGYRWLLHKQSSASAILSRAVRSLLSGRSWTATLAVNLGVRRSYKQVLRTPDAVRLP